MTTQRTRTDASGQHNSRAWQEPRTLWEAHIALVKIRPKHADPLSKWQAYYERSAAVYAEIAEIDRGHHHEALYWADRERRSAQEIAAQIKAEQQRKGVR